jgi:hypothetical protein
MNFKPIYSENKIQSYLLYVYSALRQQEKPQYVNCALVEHVN